MMIALNWSNRRHYLALMRVDKPIGTYLVAWPTLWALWFAAAGLPDLTLLLVFIVGAFLMRSAGCVINDFADRDFDGHVTRTQLRPLAQGLVSPREAIELFVMLITLAACLLFFTNQLTQLLAIGALLLASLYPFMKRYTSLPQIVLGMAFSWAVPMAFAAQQGQVPGVVWQLYFAIVVWVVAYDTIYAMVDREDDLRIGIKSTAVLFGRYDKSIIALLQMVFVAQMILVGVEFNRGSVYLISVILAGGLFVYQQWLIVDRDTSKCFTAFLNNHYVGMLIFIGIALDYWLT